MLPVETHIRQFPQANFLDFFVLPDYDGFERAVLILSRERDNNRTLGYFLHVFGIQNNLMLWRGRRPFNITGLELRQKSPMVSLADDLYTILVHKSEFMLIFASTRVYRQDFILRTTRRVRSVFPC